MRTYGADATGGPALAIHGGAGARPGLLDEDARVEHHAALVRAVEEGGAVLDAGGAALDAVCAAVLVLEDCPLFNSARGAALNADGRAELDAAVMAGSGHAGAVAGARIARNPVLAARAVMERTDHVMMIDPAEALLTDWEVERADPGYFVTAARLEQLASLRDMALLGPRHGTVGAVARDVHGRLAAATSTGGTANQLPGRVGDTPLIGAGTWAADDTVAVSCTGVGETFMRQVVAHGIDARMRYAGASMIDAVADAMGELGAAGGSGGLIAVDRDGALVLTYNTEGMFSGWLERGEVRTHV